MKRFASCFFVLLTSLMVIGNAGVVPTELFQNASGKVIGGEENCNKSDRTLWDCRNSANEPDPQQCSNFFYYTASQPYLDRHSVFQWKCTGDNCLNIQTWSNGDFFCIPFEP